MNQNIDPNYEQNRSTQIQKLPQQYKFTPEEIRVLKECNRDSFYTRCMPISTVLGLATYAAVKSGFLRPNPRFGATPKIVVAAVVGYFVGKFSYQQKCAEKLMQLPNSPVGEILRKRRQGTYQESFEPGFGPSISLGTYAGAPSQSNTYTDLNPTSTFDMDTSRPQLDGLDDTHRPTIDSPGASFEEEMPPVQKHVTTYDELRKQNREEHQQKRTLSYQDPQRGAPSRPPTGAPAPQAAAGHKNKYGDDFE